MSALAEAPGPRERRRLLARLAAPAAEAAQALLGCVLIRRGPCTSWAVRIVETEAYLGGEDPAAHAWAGRTRRTEPLWGDPGTVYVYRIYGLHHCLNLAVDRVGVPGCVLIRAAEPLASSGLAADACRGPGRLCRALAIDKQLSGRHLFEADPPLTIREGTPPARVAVSRRIGISLAAERLLRFFDADSAFVSASRARGVSSLPTRGAGVPPAAGRRERGLR